MTDVPNDLKQIAELAGDAWQVTSDASQTKG
jgi:hypothetical protein